MAETRNLDDTLIMDQAGGALSPHPDAAAPKHVGHYDLKREIGRGALSVVYEAEDTRTGQEVALKLLTLSSSLTPLEAEALIARFEREARTAARLSHPNIVHIHEVGAEQGRHFLAMEYLKGQTLRERIKAEALMPTEIFSVLAQIAGALDAVHKAGIVHRDVKPTNIILLPDGTARLLDFGIARSSRETAITHRGMIVGSPSYMAPEQIKGDIGTKATDIWALGVLSYELLAGHLPFTGPNIGGVMFQIMHEAPAAMPDLPPAVQKVLLRALDKRPSQRYVTAGALVQALKLACPSRGAVMVEQKPAALPNSVKLPKPAMSFSLPGPKWLPEAALLSLFLLGFSGAYLVRLHTGSHTQKAATGLTAGRSLSQVPAPASASEPPFVLQAPQPQDVSPDAPPRPDPDPAAAHSAPAAAHSAPAAAHSAPAAAHSAPAVSVPFQAQEQPQRHPAPVMQAKQPAAPGNFRHIAPAIAAVPAPPYQPALTAVPAAPRQMPMAAVLTSHSRVSSARHPVPMQLASRHLPVPTLAQQATPEAGRPEPEPDSVQPVPAPSAAPPVPAQSANQAVTLPAGENSYDPEAEARHRKSAWSQDGAASHP